MHFLWTFRKRTKEETSEVLCVEFSVVWCRDLDTMAEWAKTTGSIWGVDMGKDGACKMEKIKYSVVLERVGEGRIMLEMMKKKKRNWLSHWLRWICLLKDALEGLVNGNKVRGRRRYQMIELHYGKWSVRRYEKEGWEEGRVEDAEFAVKDLPFGRTLWLIDSLIV